MSRRDPTVLLVDERGWRLAWPGGTAAGEDVDDVLATLDEVGRGRRVTLALPASACPSARISLRGLPRRGRRRAMLYKLEERLPVAAEDVAAAFVDGVDDAIGVAVDAAWLSDLVQRLEELGLDVERACPATLLAAQATLARRVEADVLIWKVDGDDFEAIVLEAGMPAAWLTVGDGELPPEVRMATLDLSREPKVERREENAYLAAVVGGAATSTPWADVLPGLAGRADPAAAGARRALTAALLAIAALLGVASAGLLWGASQYRDLLAATEAAQVEAFEQAFPGVRVPPPAAIPRRLRIAATDGDGEVTTTAGRSALDLLGDVLQEVDRIPRNRRFQIDTLRLGESDVEVAGETRTLGDADFIASALRNLDDFAIESPTTEQLSPNRVAFRLSAVAVDAAGGRP